MRPRTQIAIPEPKGSEFENFDRFILIKQQYGLVLPPLNFDGAYLGKISTHGSVVNVTYSLGLP